MIEHRLYNESNLATMARMADNSVDAIVTDPPYGLGSPPPIVDVLTAWLAGEVYHPGGRGFMGKEWDAFVPGPEIWRECLRVLKPGGHLISFFGTRTYHLGTLAIQLAGFEVRDQLAWIYGCLSEDTEILTENGWMLYSHIRKSKNTRIFAYNKSTDTYELELPEGWSEYQINDTCFRIKSDFTDQIVSRHHRCLVEREGVLVFETAEQIWEKGSARVPFLEGVSSMFDTIHVYDKGAGGSEQDLLAGLQVQDDFKCQKERSPKATCGYRGLLRRLREVVRKAQFTLEKGVDSRMRPSLQREVESEGVDKAFAQRVGGLDGAINDVTKGEDVRREQPCMEGRRYAGATEGELWQVEDKVGEMSERVSWHGSTRWMDYGGEITCCAGDRAKLDKSGECASCGPQSREQFSGELDAIFEQCGSQAFRARTGYKTTLVAVTAVQYEGIVFCPTVSTGAFVARRNGKIFLTGNSGFPKGQDISKAIDKVPKAKVIDFAAALKSRRIELGLTISAADNLITGGTTMYSFLEGRTVDGVLTVYPPTVSYYLKIVECFGLKGWDDIVENNLDIVGAQAGNYGYQLDGKRWVRMRMLTAPSSPLAKQYDGWNTNLKPAQENIVLARKPLIGTVAANVMEYGTGGLNIDGCRIGDEERTYKGSGAQKSKLNNHGTGDTGIGYADGSSKNKEYTAIGRYPANVLHDGSPEVLQFFPSAPGQLSPSRTTAGEKTNAIYGKMNHNSEQMMPRQDESTSAARFFYCAKSSGSERGDFNDHPTVKPVSLMRWLVRLITPPGGVVYDPFAGSGSTLIAAFQEGFECIGSELDAHYCDIYEKRKLMFPRTQSLL